MPMHADASIPRSSSPHSASQTYRLSVVQKNRERLAASSGVWNPMIRTPKKHVNKQTKTTCFPVVRVIIYIISGLV